MFDSRHEAEVWRAGADNVRVSIAVNSANFSYPFLLLLCEPLFRVIRCMLVCELLLERRPPCIVTRVVIRIRSWLAAIRLRARFAPTFLCSITIQHTTHISKLFMFWILQELNWPWTLTLIAAVKNVQNIWNCKQNRLAFGLPWVWNANINLTCQVMLI